MKEFSPFKRNFTYTFTRRYTYTFEYFLSSRSYDRDYYEENKFDMLIEKKFDMSIRHKKDEEEEVDQYTCKTFTGFVEVNSNNSNCLDEKLDYLDLITIGKFSTDKSKYENIEDSKVFIDFFNFIKDNIPKGKYIYWSLIKYPTAISKVIPM